MFYIIIAALSGVSIIISRIINANLSSKIGTYQSTFYNFLTGLLFSMILLFFSGNNPYFLYEYRTGLQNI